jgi:polyisoprenoid-binding protein YceI
MMVGKVRGAFRMLSGTIVTSEDPLDSSVAVFVDLSSIDTGNSQRDTHLRSSDFFELDKYPTMGFRSTDIRQVGDSFELDGELSLHGVVRPLTLVFEPNGFIIDPYGQTRAGFSAQGELVRSDFGLKFNIPMDGGGVVVSDKVQIAIEVEAILRGSGGQVRT